VTRIRGIRRYLRLPRSIRAQSQEDVEAEVRFHLEMRVEELIDSGMAPHDARERAQEEFGDLEAAVDYCRRQTKRREQKVRGMEWFKSAVQDGRFAVRILTRNRGFTLVVLATIALGIGANTAIFSVVNAVLLRPFPFEDPERLVTVWESNPDDGLTYMTAAPPNFADWREQSDSFEELAAFRSRTFFFDQGEGPARIQGSSVTTGLFEALRVTPQIGRTITPEEDVEGADPVVILSYGFWSGRLGADPATIGSDILLNDTSHRVIGIMSPGFEFPPPISLEGPAPERSELWVPLAINEVEGSRQSHNLQVIGRMREGVTLEQARSELSVLAGRLQQQYPESNTGWTTVIEPLDEQVFGDLKTPLLLLLAAVGFVLLIACVNVANLLLARGAGRQRELATRASLGAGRSRLTRQLLAESLFLALMGGVLGLALAFIAVELLIVIAPQTIPRLHETSVDLNVAAFTLIISLVTGVLFGLVPALQGRKVNLSEQMREGGSRSGVAGRTSRFRSGLIVVEIALSLVLLFGAGLMLKSFRHLQGVDKGFEADNALTLRITMPAVRYAEDPALIAAYQEIEEQVSTLPGVVSAGFVYDIPLSADRQGTRLTFAGAPPPQSPSDYVLTNFTINTPGYFDAMGIEVRQGRDFTPGDQAESEPVAIVNRAFARSYIDSEDPLSKSFGDPGGGDTPTRIIGVVDDVRHGDLATEATPVVYVPYYQNAWGRSMSLVVRTSGRPTEMLGAIRQRILAFDSAIPIYDVRTLREVVSNSIAEPRFTAILLGLFSVMALLLSLIGIYSLVRYSVSQRVQEIGIRTALGAVSSDIVGMIVWHGMKLTLVGIILGIGAALLLARVLVNQLFEVSTGDPLTLVIVPLLLSVSALAACYLPAMRAARVDPVRALREE